MMNAVKWILVAGLAGYGAFVVLLYVAQRSLMYLPDTRRIAPAVAGLPEAEEVVLPTNDGENLVVWHIPPHGEAPVVLYFQGNGAGLALRAPRFRAIAADGTGVTALGYRGYSGSTGRPSEAGLLRDAAAVYEFAVARYGAVRIVLWGESLGAAVAVALAAERPVARIVLESPFTSAVDVAASVYFFVPVRWLMKDQFRSDERIGKVRAPILVLHGERDDIIPISYGEQLYQRITSPKRFVRLPNAGHNDHDAHGAVDAVRAFVAGREPP
jgi:fermentation-respiration switch protein FrsA (DUF1100 family)